MRTTVNIDDQLLAAVKVEAARGHRTIGSVIEDALRAHLGVEPVDARLDTAFREDKAKLTISGDYDLAANGWVTPTGMQIIPAKKPNGPVDWTGFPDRPFRTVEETDALIEEMKGEW
ncbi:ribbon-helix-helix protein, CopG family [Nocardioides sp.]|uniref:ribbon-helix-helix protein, CopG family n=1 Tax=Nocardioides sp. TaxID=35761 RepID=UPI0039E67884